jgi:hypothetical protein
MDLQTKSSQIVEINSVPAREVLVEMLQSNVYEVTFDKLNGEERVMSCTLDPNILPPATKEDALTQTKVRNLEDRNIVVWDVNAKGWRSFRYDRVKRVEFTKL